VTTYTPYPKVKFNSGVEYANNTIAGISITTGRQDIMEQPRAGSARIDLWTSSDTPLAIALSDPLKVQIQNSAGTYVDIFTGTISDIDITLDDYGSVGSIARYSVNAVGSLAQLNKRTAGLTNYPKENDGVRILKILTEAFLTNWTDVSLTQTWQQLPTTVTWATYDGVNIALVNNLAGNVDAGVYELTNYTGGETNAYQLAVQAAQSGRGVLYEGSDGDLHYDGYSTRAGRTPITLVADDLLADGLKTAAQWSEIVNDVTLTYQTGSATKTARDEQSIVLYGQLAGSRDTQLEQATQAQDQANAFLASRAYPRMYPEQLTVPLHSPTITDAKRDALIGVFCGTELTTSILPAVFGKNFTGYVEGIKWNITRYTADLTMIVSAESENYPHLVWFQIPVTTTWAGYTPNTTKWQDL
jgi:hypothetical protein